MDRKLSGILLVVVSATGFGSLPFFALNAYGHGISVSTLLGIRFALASLLFFAFCRTRGPVSPGILPRNSLGSLFVLGILYCIHSSLYLRSVKLIPPALAALIFYSYPVLVTLTTSLRGKVTPHPAILGSIGASSLGLAMVLGASMKGGANTLGISLAAMTAIAYSVYIVLSGKIVHELPSALTSAYVSGFASLALFGVGAVTGELGFAFEPGAWIPILGLTFCASVLGMFGLFKGIEHIGPSNAAVISTIEPVVTAVLGAMLLNQSLGAWQLVGGILVLLGALLVSAQVGSSGKSDERHRDDVGERSALS